MIPDKMKVLSQLHRLHHHHHHHQHQDRDDRLAYKKDLALGRKAAHWSKKSQRVARKMSKLEEKLRKYKDNCNALVVDLEDEDEALSSSSINNDDAPLERADRRHHRHHHHHHRRGGRGHQRNNDGAASCSADSGDSSDSSSSDSDSDDSKSAGSSRSVSPRQRRHRRHQHPHHHHQRRQRRGKPSDTTDRDAQDDDGIYGCVYRILSRSEPSLHDESCSVANAAAAAVGESQSAVVVDLEAHSYCTARDDDSERGSAAVVPAQVSQDCEMMNEDDEKIEDVDDVVLEDGWKKIVLEGLSAEDKAALTSKYSVAKRAHILQAPRLNPELRLVAGPRALERDLLLASQQSQLGSGLKALARGLGCLRGGCSELEKNPSVAEALGQLEDASRLLLDAHRDASRARRLEMRADLRHEARDALDHHRDDDDVDRATTINDADGWLFGGEAAARLKDLRCFKKCQRREERREARSEKGQKRKLAQGRAADQSKRTTSGRDSSSNKKQLDNLAELSIKNS